MFNYNLSYDDIYKNIKIINKEPNKDEIKEVLKPHGFFWAE